jgi:hypothetical protein
MGVRNYNADEVTITLGAILIEDGFDDGEFLTIEPNEDLFVAKHGSDGSISRSRTNNRSALATIKLMSTSPTNAAFSALAELDQITPNGAGIVPFLCKDNSGNTIHESSEAWIHKLPSSSYDREATAREWVIYLARHIAVEAGN